MFNNSEPPVSLFSFQDIITSLTGIMIVFLLLLSLNMLESVRTIQESSPVYKELQQSREKNDMLRKQISEIESDIRNYRQRIQNARKKDKAELLMERFQLEKDLADLKRRLERLTGKLKDGKEKYSRSLQLSEKIRTRQKDLEQKQKERKKFDSEIEQKRAQVAELRKKIEKRRREVQVTIDSSIKKIPVLIECSEDRIRIIDTQKNTRQVFLRKSPVIPPMVAEAVRYLKLFAPRKYYFVFMVKPSAARYIDFFQKEFRSNIGNASCGFEPVLEREGVPDE